MNVIDFANNTAKLSGRITVNDVIHLISRQMLQCNCVRIFFLGISNPKHHLCMLFLLFLFCEKEAVSNRNVMAKVVLRHCERSEAISMI